MGVGVRVGVDVDADVDVNGVGLASVDGAGGADGGFAVDVEDEGRRPSSLSGTLGIGGSTGGPVPIPLVPGIRIVELDADEGDKTRTGIGAGRGTGATGATIEPAGSVRLMRSPEISSSRTASHAQRMRRAHSSTSGKRMRTWSSLTTSVRVRTAVAKNARVSVDADPDAVEAGAAAAAIMVVVGGVEDDGAKERDGEGWTRKGEEEEEEEGEADHLRTTRSGFDLVSIDIEADGTRAGEASSSSVRSPNTLGGTAEASRTVRAKRRMACISPRWTEA